MKISLGYIALGAATLLFGTATAFSVRTPQQYQQTNSLSRSWAVSRGGESPSSASSSALHMSSDEFVKNEIEANEVRTVNDSLSWRKVFNR